MDVDKAFNRIELAMNDREKTAFTVDNQLFQFNVMPFGSKNAPPTFQRLMDRILLGLTWKTCLCYMDDIIIFSKSFTQHIIDVEKIIKICSNANLLLKPSKCIIADNKVDYLGFSFTTKGMTITKNKLEAITSKPPPKSGKNLYSFLCGVQYYCRLIPRWGELTNQLYKMCESKKKFVWDEKNLNSYEQLKKSLVTAPILAYPDFNKPFIMKTDASSTAIGGFLAQNFELIRPISFASRKLNETERKYTVSERELLAIVYCHSQFSCYIYGRHVECFTDHKPLVTMRRLKRPFDPLGRLFHKLEGADITLKHISGRDNFLPDFMSRVHESDTPTITAHQINI